MPQHQALFREDWRGMSQVRQGYCYEEDQEGQKILRLYRYNPECDFMVWQKPSGEKCPRCGKLLLEKGNKLVCMDEQCGYVKNKPTEEK